MNKEIPKLLMKIFKDGPNPFSINLWNEEMIKLGGKGKERFIFQFPEKKYFKRFLLEIYSPLKISEMFINSNIVLESGQLFDVIFLLKENFENSTFTKRDIINLIIKGLLM